MEQYGILSHNTIVHPYLAASNPHFPTGGRLIEVELYPKSFVVSFVVIPFMRNNFISLNVWSSSSGGS